MNFSGGRSFEYRRGIWLVIIYCCVSVSFLQITTAWGISDNNSKAFTPIISLISNPNEYHGKKVVVVGYLVKGSTYTLYLSKDDAEHVIIPNAIDVSLDDGSINAKDLSGYDNALVLLEGTFDKYQDRIGMMSGGMHKIDRISLWDLKENTSRQVVR